MIPKELSEHPAVRAYLTLRAVELGSAKSSKKAKSSAANGKKGGRPKKPPQPPPPATGP